MKYFTEREFSGIFSLAGGNFASSKREFPVALPRTLSLVLWGPGTAFWCVPPYFHQWHDTSTSETTVRLPTCVCHWTPTIAFVGHRHVPSAVNQHTFWRSLIRCCWTSIMEQSANPTVSHYTRTISTSTQNASVWSVTAAAPSDSVCSASSSSSSTRGRGGRSVRSPYSPILGAVEGVSSGQTTV